MRYATPLAGLAGLTVLLTVLSAVVGLPAALGSTPALATAGIVVALVATLVFVGHAGSGPRTPYW